MLTILHALTSNYLVYNIFFPITIYVCNELSLHHQVIDFHQKIKPYKLWKEKKGKTILVAIFCFARNQNFILIVVKFV